LNLINQRGPCDRRDMLVHIEQPEVNFDHNAVIRLRSRNLIISHKMSKDNYKYDLTDLGLACLDALEKQKTTAKPFKGLPSSSA
jgi:hypothetical protein